MLLMLPMLLPFASLRFVRLRVYAFLLGDTLDNWSPSPFELIKDEIQLIPPVKRVGSDLERGLKIEWERVKSTFKKGSLKRVRKVRRKRTDKRLISYR